MTLWDKSLLLTLLRQHLEGERTLDWQMLHKRDRGWFLNQEQRSPWQALKGWLDQWRESHASLNLLAYLLSIGALALGFSLIAGLVEFLTFERINLLWFFLIAILLPIIWWLAALFFTSAQVPIPLWTLVEQRLPAGAGRSLLSPLIKRTVLALGQQLSLLFAIGMLIAFSLYLTVTDLAFGWSSTLNVSAVWIHQATHIISWPWAKLWPAAAPSLELIEKTHYYRAAPSTIEQPVVLGQWWPFLLMSLISYVFFPRLLTHLWHRFRLKRELNNTRANDALISGLWQRLTTEFLDHEAEEVEHLAIDRAPTAVAPTASSYAQVVCWGFWPDDLLQELSDALNGDSDAVYWLPINATENDGYESVAATLSELSDEPLLLLCKGWEPPTGELADFCEQLAELRSRIFVWPVPLEGLGENRQLSLLGSWQAFLQQQPEQFHLINQTVQKIPEAGGV